MQNSNRTHSTCLYAFPTQESPSSYDKELMFSFVSFSCRRLSSPRETLNSTRGIILYPFGACNHLHLTTSMPLRYSLVSFLVSAPPLTLQSSNSTHSGILFLFVTTSFILRQETYMFALVFFLVSAPPFTLQDCYDTQRFQGHA